MRHFIDLKNEEQGSAMVVALVMLVLLTLIGIIATRTSEIEILTARNEKLYINEFIVADSAWREGIEWLNTLAAPPNVVNQTLFSSGVTDPETGALNVKNYGESRSFEDGSITIDDNDIDGTLNSGDRGVDVDYWYEVGYLNFNSMSGVTVPGSGPGYKKFYFRAKSYAGDNERSVEVTAGKIFQVGY